MCGRGGLLRRLGKFFLSATSPFFPGRLWEESNWLTPGVSHWMTGQVRYSRKATWVYGTGVSKSTKLPLTNDSAIDMNVKSEVFVEGSFPQEPPFFLQFGLPFLLSGTAVGAPLTVNTFSTDAEEHTLSCCGTADSSAVWRFLAFLLIIRILLIIVETVPVERASRERHVKTS